MSAETAATPEPPEPPARSVANWLYDYMMQAPAWTPAPEPAPEAGAAGAPPSRLLTVDELLARPPRQWLISHLVPEHVLACVYGPPASGKSFLALDWALCVATGRPWAGHAVRSGPVLYIAAEGDSGLGARIEAWEAQYGLMRGAPFFVLPTAVNLLADEERAAVLGDLAGRGLTSVALVVVDTLARCMVGGDENSARDMGRVIASADQLREATGATVLIIHHTGKNGGVERGSSALRGACDMMGSVSSDDGVVGLECDKMKDAAPFAASRWALVPRNDSCVLLPTSEVLLAHPDRPLSPAQRKVLEAVAGPVLAGSGPAAEIRAATSLADTTLYRALNGLLDRGFLTVEGDQPKLYRLTDAGADMV